MVAVTRATTLHWPLSEEQFAELCTLNPEMRFEYTSTGDLIIMTSTGGWTGHLNMRLAVRIGSWAEADGTGLAFDSSTLFRLPNGAMRLPDVSWVSRERWDTLSPREQSGIVPLCPDFVLELHSPSDQLSALQHKMQEYLDNGARLGWLIDPIQQVVYVYQPNQPVEHLESTEAISGEPVLPAFNLSLAGLWSTS
ncbi:MAG: hypothetical protein ETSY1_30205 [Candidatus Entotheonella factor]|uniref:Putative restriction endonuclease domain-containing protein n=1 Tax=Entotheonella factor TaxID=1429438 RepID=W4LDY8_ENTF1|nr:Uma2 family endonuclease [Candidatus Entotheonella palauensis]ETW95546.1 MAG: hypothetical protein ETSY1_30205 [Candidatus Entotheonella factor]